MFPNLNPTFIMLIIGASLFVLMMFLPSLLELKKPRDAGPRLIGDYKFLANFQLKEMPIGNLEEKYSFDQTIIMRIVDVVNVLPNLEA